MKSSFQHFIEPEGSLPCSQERSTGSYPEPVQSNPSHLSKIHFNIVHPPTPWSSQWSLSFWISHQYPTCIPLLPQSCYMPCLPHPPWFDHSSYTWRRVQVMKLLIMQFSPTSSHFISLLSNLRLHLSWKFCGAPGKTSRHTGWEPLL
jgi:hypothetical protein